MYSNPPPELCPSLRRLYSQLGVLADLRGRDALPKDEARRVAVGYLAELFGGHLANRFIPLLFDECTPADDPRKH